MGSIGVSRAIRVSMVLVVALTYGVVGTAKADPPIIVTTTLDELSANGRCSLREAIIAANADRQVDACRAGNGSDLIHLKKATYQLSVEGILEDAALTGDLDVRGELAIVGVGSDKTSIRGDTTDRVFDVATGARAAMSRISVVGVADMTLRGQDDPGYLVHGYGGGIRNAGDLSLSQTRVSGVSYGHGGCRYCWDGDGGGIFNDRGTVTIEDSVVSGKAAFGGALTSSYGTVRINGTHIFGEAIEYGSALTLYATNAEMTQSRVEGSRSDWCCSIITGAPGGSLIIRDSTIVNNFGGIHNVGPGQLSIIDTTIAGNTGVQAGAFGDAAPLLSNGVSATAELLRVSIRDNTNSVTGIVDNAGSMTLRDSVVARNSIASTGGIDSSYPDSSLTLVNTTVSGNSGFQVGGLQVWSGTIRSSTIADNDGIEITGGIRVWNATIANSVIALNTSTSSPSSPDCWGPAFDEEGQIASLGYVFLQAGLDCDIVGDTVTNIRGVDPQLGRLGDNGGTTLSHIPLANGPLIDAGSRMPPSDVLGACPPFDQIGTGRPNDGDGDGLAVCDIGAIETP